MGLNNVSEAAQMETGSRAPRKDHVVSRRALFLYAALGLLSGCTSPDPPPAPPKKKEDHQPPRLQPRDRETMLTELRRSIDQLEHDKREVFRQVAPHLVSIRSLGNRQGAAPQELGVIVATQAQPAPVILTTRSRLPDGTDQPQPAGFDVRLANGVVHRLPLEHDMGGVAQLLEGVSALEAPAEWANCATLGQLTSRWAEYGCQSPIPSAQAALHISANPTGGFALTTGNVFEGDTRAGLPGWYFSTRLPDDDGREPRSQRGIVVNAQGHIIGVYDPGDERAANFTLYDPQFIQRRFIAPRGLRERARGLRQPLMT